MDDTKFDAKRRLCPDGACIGIIGPNGRCSECGRTAGDAAKAAATAEPSVDADSSDSGNSGDDLVATATGDDAPAAASSDSGFNPGRRLCDDGSCLGIIGPDGRCNVCGTKAA